VKPGHNSCIYPVQSTSTVLAFQTPLTTYTHSNKRLQRQTQRQPKMIAPISLALLASVAVASPVNINIAAEKRDMMAYSSEVTIHESCNSTQRRMLEQALA